MAQNLADGRIQRLPTAMDTNEPRDENVLQQRETIYLAIWLIHNLEEPCKSVQARTLPTS